MSMRWCGFDLKQIGDAALRSQLKKLDVWLKQQSASTSTITTVTVSGPPSFAFGSPVAIGSVTSDGTSGQVPRSDHVHAHGSFATGDYHSEYIKADGTRDFTGEVGTDVGTFRSDVASGGTGFTFNTSNSFTSGDIFRFNDNASGMLAQSFEGHISTIRSESATLTADLLHVRRTLVDDNRTPFRGINIQPAVSGVIAGVTYSPTLTGINCAMTFNPTSMSAIGSKTVNGGVFAAAINGAATATVATVRGGLFNVTDSGASMPVTNAYAGHFQISGSFAGGLTNVYGAKTDAITVGTNRWGGNFGNRVAITSPAADAQEVLNLTQSNTGATEGVHVKFSDKAGDPPTPAAGDLWRNGDSFYFRRSGDTVDLAAAAAGGITSTEFFLDFGTREVSFA